MIQAFQRFALAASAAPLLTGCALSQPAIGIPGVVSQNQAHAARDDSSKYKVLYRFHGRRSDGSHPSASLLDVNGVLYGTTIRGGNSEGGTVFTITTSGAEERLYSFKRLPDGTYPHAGLIDVNGTLYGTTSNGGDRRGTVFSVSTGGVEQILYKFPINNLRGSYPSASLLEKNGIFYGTTGSGGAYSAGTVFGITTGSTVTETVLHSFGGTPDGRGPSGPVIDIGGTFYGTTFTGGAYSGCACGTVYTLTKSGAEKVLYSFGSGTDGRNPEGGLLDMRGTLYGTTFSGGTYNKGTVFSITTSGLENVLYNFTGGTEGGSPVAGLINVNGTLYGTTSQGGNVSCNCGTIYSIGTNGAEKVLHSFEGGSDGYGPYAKLLKVKRVLYGTTEYGGDQKCGAQNGCGTVFALSL